MPVVWNAANLPLSRQQIGAGVDAETGLPELWLAIEGERKGCLRIEGERKRYLIDPEAALEMASVLLVGARPNLLPVLVMLLTRETVDSAREAASRGRFRDVGRMGAGLRGALDVLEDAARLAGKGVRAGQAEQAQPATTPDHECG